MFTYIFKSFIITYEYVYTAVLTYIHKHTYIHTYSYIRRRTQMSQSGRHIKKFFAVVLTFLEILNNFKIKNWKQKKLRIDSTSIFVGQIANGNENKKSEINKNENDNSITNLFKLVECSWRWIFLSKKNLEE